MVWLILFGLLAGIRSELSLIESDVIVDHRFHERGMFRGEFDCLNETLHGRRKFFEFGLTICNDGRRHVILRDERKLLKASLQYQNGSTIPGTLTNITLPFLRDSICKGHIFYTRGKRYTLGGECCCKFSLGIPCMWIDITNLTLPEQLQFHLQLSNVTPITISLRLSELEEEFEKGESSRVNGFVFILALGALVVVLLPYSRWKFRMRLAPPL